MILKRPSSKCTVRRTDCPYNNKYSRRRSLKQLHSPIKSKNPHILAGIIEPATNKMGAPGHKTNERCKSLGRGILMTMRQKYAEQWIDIHQIIGARKSSNQSENNKRRGRHGHNVHHPEERHRHPQDWNKNKWRNRLTIHQIKLRKLQGWTRNWKLSESADIAKTTRPSLPMRRK